MVAPRDGSQSARSGRGGDDRRRIPSMQLARLNDGAGAEGKQGASESSWTVAIAEPMPPLHGFCLAVVGLETGMVGAAVTLVKRSVAATEEEAAVGFLGFEKVKNIVLVFGGDISSTQTIGRGFSADSGSHGPTREYAHPILQYGTLNTAVPCTHKSTKPSPVLADTTRRRIPSLFSARCP